MNTKVNSNLVTTDIANLTYTKGCCIEVCRSAFRSCSVGSATDISSDAGVSGSEGELTQLVSLTTSATKLPGGFQSTTCMQGLLLEKWKTKSTILQIIYNINYNNTKAIPEKRVNNDKNIIVLYIKIKVERTARTHEEGPVGEGV